MLAPAAPALSRMPLLPLAEMTLPSRIVVPMIALGPKTMMPLPPFPAAVVPSVARPM
jgi:hypothetical protein